MRPATAPAGKGAHPLAAHTSDGNPLHPRTTTKANVPPSVYNQSTQHESVYCSTTPAPMKKPRERRGYEGPRDGHQNPTWRHSRGSRRPARVPCSELPPRARALAAPPDHSRLLPRGRLSRPGCTIGRPVTPRLAPSVGGERGAAWALARASGYDRLGKQLTFTSVVLQYARKNAKR